MPPRNTPEYYAMGLIDQILLQGHDSWLYQALVQRGGYTGDINGGINLLGNMFDYEGPMLWMASLYHDASHSPDEILKVADATIDSLARTPIDAATLARAQVKERADLYNILGGRIFGSAAPISSRRSRSSTTIRPASIRSNAHSARSHQPSSRKPPANTSAPATRRSSPS